MLSILIPTYNYIALPLVQELASQVSVLGIDYEILVLDDGSTILETINENEQINLIKKCSYNVLEKNIGRSAIRNLLAKMSKFEWLLFLDADTMPTHKGFILEYLKCINKEEKIVYGGIKYQKEKPNAEQILRWHYGTKREALNVKQRNRNKYLSFLTLNFLVKKSVFEKVKFNEIIPNLRHEDTLFSFELKQFNIPISHIENPIYHLGIEDSKTFLKKSEESVRGLHYLVLNNLITPDYTKLSLMYFYLNKFKIRNIFEFFLFKIKKLLVKNILSNLPSLFIFDLYRICYYCEITKNDLLN